MELINHITGFCGEHHHLNITHLALFVCVLYVVKKIKEILV